MISGFYNCFLIIFLVWISLISIYFEIKFRCLPKNIFCGMLLITFFFNITEIFLYKYCIFMYFFYKFFFLSIAFCFSFYLFYLNIIGGGDSKVIFLLFLIIPLRNLTFLLLYSFFLHFFIFLLFIILFNIILNYHKKNTELFRLYLLINNENSLNYYLFFLSFFTFYNFTRMTYKNDVKYCIRSVYFFFNYKCLKIQLLVQIKFPFIILLICSFWFTFILFK